jgi:hypothetical protein
MRRERGRFYILDTEAQSTTLYLEGDSHSGVCPCRHWLGLRFRGSWSTVANIMAYNKERSSHHPPPSRGKISRHLLVKFLPSLASPRDSTMLDNRKNLKMEERKPLRRVTGGIQMRADSGGNLSEE